MIVQDILKGTGGILLQGDPLAPVKGISIDSRTLRKGEAFFAIKGRRFDGHEFLATACKKGASAVIVSRRSHKLPRDKNLAVIRVNNTIAALGDLAYFHRSRLLDIPVVAITGSNGKTTVKEMTAEVLGRKFRVLKNEGTLNNHIGVPLSLLKLDRTHQCAVLELGASKKGEIGYLARMVRPDVSLITNIGPSHLEWFKDEEGVFQTKKEILAYTKENGTVVLNGDDLYLIGLMGRSRKNAPAHHFLFYGTNPKFDCYGSQISYHDGGWHFLLNGKYVMKIPTLARHNVLNALAAISVGFLFSVPIKEVQEALKRFSPPGLRMEFKRRGGLSILSDCYNANPASYKSLLETVARMRPRGRKILVSGDMLELGLGAADYHLQIGRLAGELMDIVITVGKLSRNSYKGARESALASRAQVYHCASGRQLRRLLKRLVRKGDLLIIKGSRAMKMEDSLRCFTTSSTR